MEDAVDEGLFQRLFGRLVDARGAEVRALVFSFAYFFCLLACYYVLRPVRDAIGADAGSRNLSVLFTATFIVMLIASPIYGWLVGRMGRRRFVPLVYAFFALNILGFWLAAAAGLSPVAVDRVFFVWLSVFNLFAVSVFWSFMADLFRAEQAKRLFGFIAAGGSLGVLAGPALVSLLVERIGQINLLLIALALLVGAIGFALLVERDSPKLEERPEGDVKIGGNPFAGFAELFRSPYLAGIAFWVALLSFAGTMLYFAQADIVRQATDSEEARTRIFANIDFMVGLATIGVQLLLTGRTIKAWGVGVVAAILPLVFAIGFVVLGLWQSLVIVAAFQTVQRAANFAFSNIARENLFTAADREGRFKAKNVIDGVVFRGADAANGWIYSGLIGLGFGVSFIALASAPIMIVWLALALALGRTHERRTATSSGATPKGAST
jgi:AAA family ATP:ADP antiporter